MLLFEDHVEEGNKESIIVGRIQICTGNGPARAVKSILYVCIASGECLGVGGG